MTPADAAAIAACLSTTRLSTYATACTPAANEDHTVAALRLYRWNTEISAAFMVPIHLCEVAIRNAAADALAALYGPRWPWSPGFAQALPNPSQSYSPVRDLAQVAASQPTTGKVIPELKFVFWEKLFTNRHNQRLWTPHLHNTLPNIDTTKPINQATGDIRAKLGDVRLLRNRIAHHEPIFNRQHADELLTMRTLVGYRSSEMQLWLDAVETVTALIAVKP
jgi:hypothetical protein